MPKQSIFAFTTKHSVSRTWRRQQQHYNENNSSAFFLSLRVRLGCVLQIFPHIDMWWHVWMSRFRWPWSSLNFYKEYLFFETGFETLIWDFNLCNFRDLIYAQTACNTPKRKEALKSHHMTPLIRFAMLFRDSLSPLDLNFWLNVNIVL